MPYFNSKECMRKGNFTYNECEVKALEALTDAQHRLADAQHRLAEVIRQKEQLKISNERKHSEMAPIAVFHFLGVILCIGIALLVLCLVCRCEKKKRKRCRARDFRYREPIEFTELELFNEHHQIGTLNTNSPTPDQSGQIHCNSSARSEPVNNPTAPTFVDVHTVHSNPTIPAMNNEHMPSEDLPPSYDDCMKNMPARRI